MKKNKKMTKETLVRYLKLGAAALLALILLVVWLVRQCGNASLSLGTDDTIDITPEQIQSIRDIGQWEFLSISDEELVDTIRRGFFSDDHLARIYYGTLRLGADLSKTSEGWISMREDTVVVLMPKIGLLDERFIDEARTESFHESGRWSAQDREAMYQKARRMMLSHCLTPKNLAAAQENAEGQMRQLLKGMGFEHAIIEFQE